MKKYTKYILGVALLLLVIISNSVLASETKIPKLSPVSNINLHKPIVNKSNFINRLNGVITSIDNNSYTISIINKKDGTTTTKVLKTDSKTKLGVQRPRPTHLNKNLTSNNKILPQDKINKIVQTSTLKVGDIVRVNTKTNPDGSLLAISINQRPILRIKK